MTTPLQRWRRHRVDYRLPAALALVLVVLIGSMLPELWDLFGRSAISTSVGESPPPPPLFSRDEGLQIVDVEILGPPPAERTEARAFRIVPAPKSASTAEEEAEPQHRASADTREFAWDPTQSYRPGSELLAPAPKTPGSALSRTPRRLDYLLSLDGVVSMDLADTSQTARGHLNFVLLQRRMFLENAPRWAYEKAVERYKRMLEQMAMDNPLRGPQ